MRNNKKIWTILIILALYMLDFSTVHGQDQGSTPTLEPTSTPMPTSQAVIVLLDQDELLYSLDAVMSNTFISHDYSTQLQTKGFRFPVGINAMENRYDFFDPYELSLFPHETLGEGDMLRYTETNTWVRSVTQGDWKNWGLFTVGSDRHMFRQMMYLNEPAALLQTETDEIASPIYYGRQVDLSSGTLRDFYLYMDFFVTGSTPENSGSCFLSYSNSVMTGMNTNAKVIINLGKDILMHTSTDTQLTEETEEPTKYNYYSTENFRRMTRLAEIPDNACYSADCYAMGNDIFPNEKLNQRFVSDYYAEVSNYSKRGLTYAPKIYRLELIRLNGILSVYINGDFIASIKDGIAENVAWAAGPVLFEGGESVNCDIGTLFIATTPEKGRIIPSASESVEDGQ